MESETIKQSLRVEKIFLWVFALIQSVVAFFAPAKTVLLIVGFFVVCDLLTALAAAMKLKEIISSRRLFDTIPKFIVYTVVVLLAHVIEVQFLPEIPATKLLASMVAVVELKSIDENVKKVVGKSLLKALAEMLKNSKRP